MFVNQLQLTLTYTAPKVAALLKEIAPKVEDMNTLSEAITNLVHQVGKKIILVIDEVDASSNFEPFLNFLGMLRTKYLARFKTQHATFHSIVLAGVHDIKSLKQKIRTTDSPEYNSPWNIAVDFEVEMSFQPKEIIPMLTQYKQAEKVTMDSALIAERLYYHTSGYPFLISKLCRIVVEKIRPKKQQQDWVLSDIDEAVKHLLRENNTNFDSVIKNVENNPALYDIVHRIVIGGREMDALRFIIEFMNN